MPTQPLRLTPDERRAYREDGFFIRLRAFGADELEELCSAAESAAAGAAGVVDTSGRPYSVDGNRYVDTQGTTVQFEHRQGSQTLRVIEPVHLWHERLDRLVDDPRLVEPMKDLVGCERVALFTDKLNLKRPREGSRFRWHQDSPYWVFACPHLDQLPNVMLALDDASEENGCLRVVRGSHRKGLLPGLEGEGTLGPLFTDPSAFDLSAQVPAVMPAGSLLFFSPHTVHGSQPNDSDRPRRAIVLTYQPAGHPMFKLHAIRDAA
jgi:ectoine hydroxylase